MLLRFLMVVTIGDKKLSTFELMEVCEGIARHFNGRSFGSDTTIIEIWFRASRKKLAYGGKNLHIHNIL